MSSQNDLPLTATTSSPDAQSEAHGGSSNKAPTEAFTFNIAEYLSDAELEKPIGFNATLPDGTPLPKWLNFDQTSGIFIGTPTEDDRGMTPIKVAAHVGAGTIEEIFAIMVELADGRPTATALTNRTPRKVNRFTLDATEYLDRFDAGLPASYSANLLNGSELPEWLQFDERTGAFAGAPTEDDIGGLSVLVVASNGQETANAIVSIEVENTPDGPIAIFVPEEFLERPKPVVVLEDVEDLQQAPTNSAATARPEARLQQADQSSCSIAYDAGAQAYTVQYRDGDTAAGASRNRPKSVRHLEAYLTSGILGKRSSAPVDQTALRQIAASISQSYALMMSAATPSPTPPISLHAKQPVANRGWFAQETRRDRRFKRQYRRGQ